MMAASSRSSVWNYRRRTAPSSVHMLRFNVTFDKFVNFPVNNATLLPVQRFLILHFSVLYFQRPFLEIFWRYGHDFRARQVVSKTKTAVTIRQL